MDKRYGSSRKVPALQAQSLNLNPSPTQKNKQTKVYQSKAPTTFSNSNLYVQKYLWKTVDMALVDKLIMWRVDSTLINAKNILICNICKNTLY
jgi:hypothetical protein